MVLLIICSRKRLTGMPITNSPVCPADEHKSDRSPKKAISERRPSSTLKTSRSCSLTCQLGDTHLLSPADPERSEPALPHAEVPCTWSTPTIVDVLTFGIT